MKNATTLLLPTTKKLGRPIKKLAARLSVETRSFPSCLTAGWLCLALILIVDSKLYVKRLLLVNGTAWHKATKSSKKEHPCNFTNSKLFPET
jgi:hypothetical protein